MDELFARTARLVTEAETIWADVTSQLDEIGNDLDRASRDVPDAEDPAWAAAITAAEAELRRLRREVSSDPLSMSRQGRVDTARLDGLRRSVQAPVQQIPATY